MPKNVMKLIKPSPHRARNDFDLSHRHVFSINFGELLPSTCIETVPGDHIVMHVSDLLRAIPLATSPFLRAKQHTDVWFVPYADLWHNFNQFMTQRDEPLSSALRSHSFVPHASVYDIINAIAREPSGTPFKDIVGRDYYYGARKIFNLLGYGSGTSYAQSNSCSVNLFRILAYNKIWYDEYRQNYFDDGTYLLPENIMINSDHAIPNINRPAMLFNADWLDCGTELSADFYNWLRRVNDDVESGTDKSGDVIRAMFQMRYRLWKKDLFTGLLPSTQFGSVSVVNADLLNNKVFGLNPLLNNQQAPANQVGNSQVFLTKQIDGQYIDSALYVNGMSNFDVLALKRSEAVQLWRQNALRAGNRVSDNMVAHYGVEPNAPRDHRPTFLGSVSAPINIGDVDSTAATGQSVNGQLGDIAGKGLSSLNEKVFTYDAKDFGVIIAMTSILPEAEYMASGISRPNQLLEPEDFFIPEYENLGLEAVSGFNFSSYNIANRVLGYAPRYYGYKTKLDKCYDEFMLNGVFAPWCTPKLDVYQALQQGGTALPLSCLYVNPTLFDNNFSVGVDVSPQFLCDMYFDVDAVRPMSVLGLPDFT